MWGKGAPDGNVIRYILNGRKLPNGDNGKKARNVDFYEGFHARMLEHF